MPKVIDSDMKLKEMEIREPVVKYHIRTRARLFQVLLAPAQPLHASIS
jgi:hypothetical protein